MCLFFDCIDILAREQTEKLLPGFVSAEAYLIPHL